MLEEFMLSSPVKPPGAWTRRGCSDLQGVPGSSSPLSPDPCGLPHPLPRPLTPACPRQEMEERRGGARPYSGPLLEPHHLICDPAVVFLGATAQVGSGKGTESLRNMLTVLWALNGQARPWDQTPFAPPSRTLDSSNGTRF